MKKILRAFLLFTSMVGLGYVATATPAIFVAVAVTQVVCGGASTGSINIAPGGGTGPYTYIWSNDSTTQSLSNLGAGTYSVTITDASSNQGTATITITAPPQFSVSKTITNEPCGGYNVGAVQINVTGGSPGYSHQWSNGDTSKDIANLSAAVYYVTISDANGCATIDSANVTQPPGVVISDSITDAACNNPNGAINITVQYGNPGYTYLWSDSSTALNRTGLNQGNYIITVTDTLGCTASASEVVGEAPSGMSANYHTTQPTCNNGSDGKIWMTSVVGSIGPYTFLWNDGDTSRSRTNLPAATYIITAISGTGCTVNDTINLGQPTAMNVSVTEVPYTCFGSNNGAINTTVTNGSNPYTYDWGAGITSQNRIGLTTGNYTVTVTDNNGCTMAATTTVTEPAPVGATLVATSVSCTGGNTGSITTTAVGGTTPYSYWWGAGVVSQNRTNLNAGAYTVTVTDTHGCTGTASATVAAYTPMAVAAAQTNSICFGTNSGSIHLTVTHGIGPYSYLWSNADTTQNIDSLANGIYDVTVTDNSGCTASKNYTITEPPFPITLNALVNDVSCTGDSNGSITINPANGASPYAYNWGGGITTQTRTNLAPGTYNPTITDNNGCTASTSLTITQPTPISISFTDTNVACFGGNNATIGLNVTGSYPPYSFKWSTGSSQQNLQLLSAGNYIVTVVDNHGCTAIANTTLSQPTNAALTTTVTNATCNGSNNGVINLNVTGGTPGYTYNWGGGVISQNLSNAVAGNYSVTVTDSASCTYTTTATITQPTAINIIATVTNIVCSSGNTGAINLAVSGGGTTYTFNWGGGITTQNRSGLAMGTYVVTVTDNNGCTATSSSTITQSTGLSLTSTVTNVICNGAANGTIDITPTSGTGPYSYNWGGGVISQNRSNLAAGNYTVNVTDNNGCTAANAITITQPNAISATATAVNTSCSSGNNGSINLAVTGGTSPYTFNWGAGVTTQNRTNLVSGNYSVTIMDSVGCTISAMTTIGQPAGVSATTAISNVTCNGGSNGAVTLNPTGGTGSYTYNWGGGVTTSGRTNLTSGNYTVTITDANLCTATASATITQPASIAVVANTVNVSCNGGNTGGINLNVSGGVSPYIFDWGGGVTSQNRNNIATGNYSVTVTDSNLCTAVATATINQSTGLTLSVPSENASCFGQSTGGISAMVSGGSGSYIFVWSNDSTGQNVTNIPAGTYTVTVTDANLCTATASGTVNQPPQIVSTGFVTNATCNGTANGGVVLTVNGGAGGFSYNWSNNSTGQNLQTVNAGNYSVTITDANLCTVINSFIVTQPSAILIATSNTNVSCFGGNNGATTTAVTGGSGNYSYIWNTSSTSAGINNLLAGTYTVTVKDAANCSATASANVMQPLNLSSNASIVNVSCNGGNNGSANLTVNGGTQPYRYMWSNNSSTQQVNNLAPNTYTVTVTDSHLCTSTATATISQPSPITISNSHSDYICAAKGGSLSLTTTGGVSPYSYSWGNGINAPNRTNLNAGIYTVTLTDVNGCTATSSVSINQLPAMNATLITKNVTCYNQKNGSINTIVTGGTVPYNFLWNTGATTQNIDKLSATFYEVQITDSNSCIITATTTVTQPDLIVVSPSVAPPSCNNESNGTIAAVVTGGIPGYNYIWSNQSTAPGISNISTGTYALTVTDSAGCSAIENNIIVTQPLPISASASAIVAGCTNNNGGSVDLTVSGGNPPYSFNWSNSGNTQNISGLAAGAYSVIITDTKNCTANATATVIASPPIVIASAVQNASCAGVDNGSIDLSITGGTPSFSYLWNDGASTGNLANVAPGNYAVTVTDAGGCSAASNFAVSTEYTLTVNATGSTSINEGHSTTINAVTNVDHNNIYSWSPSEFVTCSTCATTQAGPVQTTEFTIAVVDANGCKATDNINININTQINLFIPNAFSPNSDGNNDYFQIFGDFGSIVYLDVMVFDRWGEKVYESEEPQFKWDGTYKGEPAPIGVYVYTMAVAFADGSHRDYKGSVTLVK